MHDQATRWERVNGELGVVIGPKVTGTWQCGAPDAIAPSGTDTGERYTVRWKGGVHHFAENMLRAIYDGEKLSTWEKFRKVTGIRIDAPHPLRRKPTAPERQSAG